MKISKELILSELVKKYGSFSSFASSEFGYKLLPNNKGQEVRCVCPHHTSESNNRGENCSINNEKLQFNCFSCQTGGSPIDMVMQEKSLEFSEACKWLAEKLGLKGTESLEKTDVSIRRKFASICHQNLMAILAPSLAPERAKKLAPYKEEYENALHYLGTERGFIKKSLKDFEIGYCGFKGLEIEEMFSLGYSVKDLLMANIMMESSKTGKKFVPLKGRVTTMASRNLYGRKVVVEQGNEQYKHYYTRSQQQIWNLNSCKNKEREIVFVVEAIFDGIAIQQYINKLQRNWAVVATCGTGGVKKEELVKILSETNPRTVMIIPDSDDFIKNGKPHAVGQKKGLEKAYAFEKAGQNTRVVVLPNGKDPCDLAKERMGAGKFLTMVEKALYPVRYEIYLEANFNRRESYDQKQEFLNTCKVILEKHRISLREDMLNWIALLIKAENKEEVRDFFTNSFAKRDVLDYFRKCYSVGMKDEDIIAHLKTLM